MALKTIPILCVVLLTGCTTTLPVVGQFSTSKDTFMGEAVAGLNDGTMRVRSQNGLLCQGTLTRPSLVSGDGKLSCSDGRTGTFVFTKKTEASGDGFGTLSDGEKFRFHFGGGLRQSKCDFTGDSAECQAY